MQIKTELELEKRRNDRMKYDKQLNKNNLENSEKERNNLLNENEQLKGVIEELKVCTIFFFLPNIYTCLYFPQIRSHL